MVAFANVRTCLGAALVLLIAVAAPLASAWAQCEQGWVPAPLKPGQCMPAGDVDCGPGRGSCTPPLVCAPTSGCMPAGNVDCGFGRGTCPPGNVCMSRQGCMPRGSMECSDGTYCDPGMVCAGNGKCRRP
jgi:hypothetical protein